MKKLTVLFALFFTAGIFFAQIPDSLYGIWEGKDRFVFFEQSQDNQTPQITIVLKAFYGWYYDRAAEPQSYAEKEKRVINDATTKKAEQVYFAVKQIDGAENAKDVFELVLGYSKFQKSYVPVAIIDGKMYLDFYIRQFNSTNAAETQTGSEANLVSEDYNGIWRGNVKSEGIKVSEQGEKENIGCWIIDGEELYDVRYWKTDMDYSDVDVSFVYGDKSFIVKRHLNSAGCRYSCTSGRSRKVRNTQPPFKFNAENYVFNSERTVLAADKTPYLVQIADKKRFEELIQIVKAVNSRKSPAPKPLFEKDSIEWHWQLLEEEGKLDELIDQTRKAEWKYY